MTESAVDTVRERSSGNILAMRLPVDIDRRVVTLDLLALVLGNIIVASLAADGATTAPRADDPVEHSGWREPCGLAGQPAVSDVNETRCVSFAHQKSSTSGDARRDRGGRPL